jgi:hypothetical protein
MKRTAFKRAVPAPRAQTQCTYVPRARAAAQAAPLLAAALNIDMLEPQDGPSTAAGKRHMGKVAAIACVLCRRLGYGMKRAEVHHIRTGQGGAQRASDFLTAAICRECHRGPLGIHGDKSLLRLAGVTELDLLADTIAELTEGAT